MAKGPLLNEGVKRLTAEIYLQHKDWRAKEVRKELLSRLKEINPNTPDNWPSLSAIQAILKKIIDKDKAVINLGIDEPWSMGACVKYEMAQNAVDSLMEAWKYSLAVGHILTIREALWVARLTKGFAQRKHISQFFEFSHKYAIREQICELLNKPMDTRDLDAQWGIDFDEKHIYALVDMIPKEPDIKTKPWLFRLKLDAMISFAEDSAARNVLGDTHRKMYLDTYEEVASTPNAYMNDLSEKQDRMYAGILLFLSKGPKWDTLSKQEFLSLLSRTRQCVIDFEENLTEKLSDIPRPFAKIEPKDIIGPDLLSMVGYELNTKKLNKEAQHKRSRSKKV